MTTHRALIAVVPVLALAATACTANISTPAQPSATPATVTASAVTVTPSASSEAASPTATVAATTTETAVVTVVQKPPAPTATCGPDSAQAAFDANKGKLQVNGGSPDAPWVMDPSGNGYEQCGALSWIVFTNKGGSAAAPYGIMLFFHGQYLGTATKEAYAYRPQVITTSPTSISVNYRYRKDGESNAEASGSAHSTFTWDVAQQKVVQEGQLPPTK